jgi:ribosomal protein S12 methylthiotransferase accessory factor
MDARLAAAMELIERDAVALWWRGGRRARPMGKVAVEAPLRARLDAGARLLDITTENGVPAVAAISFRADGAGFCCGTAARPDLAAAARAALVELCQNELAILLVEAKRSALGAAALNPRDLTHLRRHAVVRDGAVPILHAEGAPGNPFLPDGDAAAGLDTLAARLGATGMELLFLDQTRPGAGLPVLRAIVPGLACEPSTDIPPRLAETIARHGGGPGIDPGILLFA